jgi:hypothetical protein
MKTRVIVVIFIQWALLAAAATVAAGAEPGLTDPYAILSAHYEAIGGLDLIKAEETRYFEASIELFGLKGDVREWQQKPIRKRQEVNLGVITQTTGDNGEYAWTVDVNGKLQIQKDEHTLSRREVDRRTALFEHLDRDSENLSLSYEGVEDVNGINCYAVLMTNSLNDDSQTFYIGTDDFLMHKSITREPDHEAHTVFSDFRDVGGLTIAFRHEIELLPIGQKQAVTIAKYESNPDVDEALFEPPGKGPRDYRFTHGTSAENIPFTYIADHLFIDVLINCDRRTWIIDTGASVTVVDTEYAERLGLETAGKMRGYGAGTTVEATFTELPPFAVEGIEFDSQSVAVFPIRKLLKRAGLDVVGILGYDFLSRFVVKIDYAKELLSFYDPATFQYAGDGKVIEEPMEDRFFVVPMTVDGVYAGNWTLDIGAGGTSFFFPFAERNGFLERDGVEGRAGGAGGYHPTRTIRFETAEIAGFTLEHPLISIPLQTGGAMGNTEGTGNLGNSVLRHFVLYLDYERQQVILEKGDNFGMEFPADKTGLALAENDDDEVEVFYVSPGTPADRARFQEGDILSSINGIPVELMDGVIAVRELLKAKAGTEYRVELERGGNIKGIKLKLRDLYQ